MRASDFAPVNREPDRFACAHAWAVVLYAERQLPVAVQPTTDLLLHGRRSSFMHPRSESVSLPLARRLGSGGAFGADHPHMIHRITLAVPCRIQFPVGAANLFTVFRDRDFWRS